MFWFTHYPSRKDNHTFIVEEGGIQPILNLVYSSDSNVHQRATAAIRSFSQHIGAIEIHKRYVHNRHRVTLTKIVVLEQLLILVRVEESERDIKRLSAVVIVNLASSIDNHECLIVKGNTRERKKLVYQACRGRS